MSQFTEDLAIGRRAEEIVINTFSKLYKQCEFVDVANNKEYYYIGDVKVINKDSGNERYIEVKNDSRIAETHNVLCEDEYFNKYNGEFIKGNMHNSGTWLYCVVSEQEQKIYILDYEALKAFYKKGEFKVIEHSTQDTFAFLVPLSILKNKGILIDCINY